MSEQPTDATDDFTKFVVRMARAIVELKGRVAELEGHPLPGCPTCQYDALIDGLRPAGPTEDGVYTCTECSQRYAKAPETWIEDEASGDE